MLGKKALRYWIFIMWTIYSTEVIMFGEKRCEFGIIATPVWRCSWKVLIKHTAHALLWEAKCVYLPASTQATHASNCKNTTTTTTTRIIACRPAQLSNALSGTFCFMSFVDMQVQYIHTLYLVNLLKSNTNCCITLTMANSTHHFQDVNTLSMYDNENSNEKHI